MISTLPLDCVSRREIQLLDGSEVLDAEKRLGQDVGFLLSRGKVFDRQDAILDLVSRVVIPDVDVLGPSVELGVFCVCVGALIVGVDCGWNVEFYTAMLKYALQPNCFFGGFAECDIFRLQG